MLNHGLRERVDRQRGDGDDGADDGHMAKNLVST